MSDSQSEFRRGVEFYAKEMGAFVGGENTRLTNGEYLASVQKEIDNLNDAINRYAGNNNQQLKGFVAEAWHTYTLNIDAAVKRSANRAFQEESNKLGSVDISTDWGGDYSLKYYKSGADSAIAQGHSLEWAYQRYVHGLPQGASCLTREEYLLKRGIDPKTDMSLCMYEGQARLIPSDQIKDAIVALNKRIAKEANNLDNPDRVKVAERLLQVRDKLTSHIESPDGATSANLTEAESRELAALAKEGKFDPNRFDITLAKKADLVFLAKNVMNAGLNAAWVSALIKIVPELIVSIKKLLVSGFIDKDDLLRMGKAGAIGAKDGFLRGFFCAAITTATETGLFGETMRIASGSGGFVPIVSTMVVLVGQSISDAIRYADGEMTDVEYAYNIERSITVAAGSVIGGLSLQAVMPMIPVVSYAIGSMVGSLIGGLVFSVKESVMMSLCVKHGYTVFGLVGQDYTMPDEAREKLGFPVYGFDDYKFVEYKFKEYHSIQYNWQEYKWKTLECVLLKRGVVACRKVGYIK